MRAALVPNSFVIVAAATLLGGCLAADPDGGVCCDGGPGTDGAQSGTPDAASGADAAPMAPDAALPSPVDASVAIDAPDDPPDIDAPDDPPADGFASIVSESLFYDLFPDANPLYTYWDLVAAAESFPDFATTGDWTVQRREVAAFLANIAHETGWLYYTEEIAQAPYCAPSNACPCAPNKWYYGRGPIQLSWNFNYCAAGNELGYDLRADPDLVAWDPYVAWQTGLWFWMTQTGAGWMTCHDAIVDYAGFGHTIRTINGSIECDGGSPGNVQQRIDHYLYFCSVLGVDPGGDLYC